jgi:hypothetical protein
LSLASRGRGRVQRHVQIAIAADKLILLEIAGQQQRNLMRRGLVPQVFH